MPKPDTYPAVRCRCAPSAARSMAKPRIMLLDEPSMGLAPLLVKEIFDIIQRLNEEEKVAMLLAEQNAAMALNTPNTATSWKTAGSCLTGSRRDLTDNADVKGVLPGID